MPKYDAFGRETGDDPLAAWRSEEAEAVPAEAPAPREVEHPRPAEPPRESPQRAVRIEVPRSHRRRPRVVSRLILLLVVLGAGAGLVANAGRELEQGIRDVVTVPPVPPVEAEGPPPTGLRAGSLVRPGELRRAFAQLRDTNLGRAYTVRLAPERIDTQLISGTGVMSSVQLRHDGSLDQFTRSPGNGHLETIPWAKLDPAAPARLTRRAAARLRQPATRLNYLVATLFDGRVIWGAYFKGGEIFQGDGRGRLFRRVS